MSEELIVCPSCGARIPLSEALRPFEERLKEQYQQSFAEKEKSLQRKLEKADRELEKRTQSLEEREQALTARVDQEVKAKLAKLKEVAKEEATKELQVELQDSAAHLKELEGSLKEAQERELDLRKSNRELEKKKEELAIDLERKIDEERQKIRAEAEKSLSEQHEFKVREYEEKIKSMVSQIEELKRKAEQGSQQAQGEVQEQILQDRLTEAFPGDAFNPVATGKEGGDIVQLVRSPSGRDCGRILWESKRTKAWSKTWIPKLKEDQHAAGAELAVLATQTLPEDIEGFGSKDGVVVTSLRFVVPIATLLRGQLLEVARGTRENQGRAEKRELLYGYVTSAEFRQSVQAVLEALEASYRDLESERKALQRLWKKREALIRKAALNVIEAYGRMQGIAGSALQDFPLLALPDVMDSGAPSTETASGVAQSPP
jgi:hypothetical protein